MLLNLKTLLIFRSVYLTYLAITLCCAVGCAPKEIEYRLNDLHAASLGRDASEQQITESATSARATVAELFGTPDLPKWPDGVAAVVEMEKVVRAAGPVGRNKSKIESGLYRKHCVQCHGTTGDGMGPAAALLAPYPRDFRRGSFKFKSTPTGKKPTHQDIVKTLENGIPGTAMPAFGTLNLSEEFQHDVDALANYVRFLSIRGEVERKLIVAAMQEELTPSTALETTIKVADNWRTADTFVVASPTWDDTQSVEEKAASIARGKAIFESELTACTKCHGKAGDGKGTSQDFDDWTKDWTIRAGIDPSKKSEWKPMKKYGVLKPVHDSARNLTLGAFRGGSSREDIYRRIVLGIEGSPMPAIARKENGNPGVTEEGIIDLVEYVCSLSSTANAPAVSSSKSNTEVSHAQSN